MKILFVCTGNTCRSPMAEGILRELARKQGLDLEVASAGIFAVEGQPISANALEALDRVGIDMSSHRAQPVDRELLEDQDLVLTMSRGHKSHLLANYDFLGGQVATMKDYAWSFDDDVLDPFGGSLRTYMATRDELEDIIIKIIDRLEPRRIL